MIQALTQSPPVTESDLVLRTRAGEPSAFGLLVQRHMQRAFAIAYRIVHNRQDAEDIVQEAFIAALGALDSFDVTRPFGPWFGRIVARKALNVLEKRRIRLHESLGSTLADPRATPHDQAGHTQLVARVRAALQTLPPRQRTVVELVELEGFSAVEAAGMLGISAATARWHLHEARNTLRTQLAELI